MKDFETISSVQNIELISMKDRAAYMGFQTKETFAKFIVSASLPHYTHPLYVGKYFDKKSLSEFKTKQIEFHETFYSADDLISNNWTRNEIAKLDKTEVPFYARTGKFKGKHHGYKKTYIDALDKPNKGSESQTMESPDASLMNSKQVQDYLGISGVNYRKCCTEGYLKIHSKRGRAIYCHIDDVKALERLRDEFHNKHYNSSEIESILTSAGADVSERLPIPVYARSGRFAKGHHAFDKKAIEELSLTYKKKANYQAIKESEVDNVYSYQQVKNLLGLDEANCRVLLQQWNIKRFRIKTSIFYSKTDVDLVKKEQDELLQQYKNYIAYSEALEKGYASHIINRVSKAKVTLLLKGRYPASETIYNELELSKELEIQKREELFNADETSEIKDAYAVFEKKLEIYESMHPDTFDIETFKQKSPITSREWFTYVKMYLFTRNLAKRSLNVLIRRFVYLTDHFMGILAVTQKNELYLLSTDQLVNFLMSISASKQQLIIWFLEEKNSVFKEYAENQKIYNLNLVKKYINQRSATSKQLLSADIYSVEEYESCFKYCSNLGYHIEKSIEEMKTKNKAKYASTWLYVLIHLNNAWRNGDVCSFKELVIQDLLDEFEIFEVEWFLDNQLTLSQALLIISRVENRTLVISKTRAEGYFFCSNDLAIPVATAIILLTIFKKTQNTVVNDFSDVLMQFQSKYNHIVPWHLEVFFADIELDDFIFKSKKMNASIMTYLYSITSDECSNKAIQSAAMLRGHKSLQSTLHYLKIDQEQINFISHQLFERGEFGYVYDKLTQALYVDNSKILSMEERSKKIADIKRTLANIYEVECVAGFMNLYNNEKAEVDNYIDLLSLEERQELLNKIYISSLPSKEMNIQCLISGNCNKEGKGIMCHQCAYSIANLYSISKICDAAVKHVSQYHNQSLPGEKIKLSVLVNHDLEALSQAIHAYGADLVYSFMNISRDEYRSQAESILEPEDILIELSQNV